MKYLEVCFSVLWTPEGPGAIANLALIAWFNSNVDFKYLGLTLRDWLQMAIIKKQQHTGEQLNVFMATVGEVLSGGMRLATGGDEFIGMDYLVMAHRDVRHGDQIMLPECSIPVVLRSPMPSSAPKNSDTGYHVAGGVHRSNAEISWGGMPYLNSGTPLNVYPGWGIMPLNSRSFQFPQPEQQLSAPDQPTQRSATSGWRWAKPNPKHST